MSTLAMPQKTKSKGSSARFGHDEERWEAVCARDPAAEGAFYYAVQTTGVYCRPTCPSRLPRRENASFYDSCAAAEHAGFRACRRCRPDEPTLAERQGIVVREACRVIEAAQADARGMPTLDMLARGAGMSRFHFHRVFKALTGVSPKGYADAYRARRVRDALAAKETVTNAVYSSGFNSSSRFYAASSRLLGMTPSQMRAGGKDMTIRFAVGECSLGSVLVAVTDKGVCAIELGDEPEELVRELQDRFPQAELIGADHGFEQWVAKVVGFVEAPARGFDLPLDVRGTAFQRRVWKAISGIPVGATASYTDIAKRIRAPKAVRAVAQACASNAIAIAIPCHRVVRSDGSISGYRWGVARKRELLARERAT
jgi:AraC family transcriptional regulator, regulatory protein of adaptative response / methylated-DNA-[protein]-cysteine methyltransferase